MATITVRGYCNKPATKTIPSGSKLSTFTLSEKVKDKKAEKGYTRAFYNVEVWDGDPPADGAYVEVKGYLKVRTYEAAGGQKRQSLDIKADDVCIPEPREGAAKPEPKAEDYQDLPF
jgi:single-stranded DNA-binding protein